MLEVYHRIMRDVMNKDCFVGSVVDDIFTVSRFLGFCVREDLSLEL